MFKVKHKVTEQLCEFADAEGVDGFFRGIGDADAPNWELVEDKPGVHVELTGKPVPPSGNAAKVTDEVLEDAATRIAAGQYSLAYAASGIASHYGEPRQDVLKRLVDLVAPKLASGAAVEATAEAVEAELEARARARVEQAERERAEAEQRSGGSQS